MSKFETKKTVDTITKSIHNFPYKRLLHPYLETFKGQITNLVSLTHDSSP